MALNDIKAPILESVVDHVQAQFNILKESTDRIPGFHQDILPRFELFVDQVKKTANELQGSSSPPLTNAYSGSLVAIFNDLAEHCPTEIDLDSFASCDLEIETQIERLVQTLQGKANAAIKEISQANRQLQTVQHHITLVKLSERLDKMINENPTAQFDNIDKEIGAAQARLRLELNAILRASEIDVKNVVSKLSLKSHANQSPPSFTETPCSSRQENITNEGSVPPLWSRINLASLPTGPTAVQPPHRLTLDAKRSALANVFEDDDHTSELDPMHHSKQITKPPLLSSQLTFRQKVQSPRFGTEAARVRKPAMHTMVSVKKTGMKANGRRLSLGSKMARQSISHNMWNDL